MRKTVKVPQEVYDQLADYSAENGVTLQEAATELLGGAFDSMGEPEVLDRSDEYPARGGDDAPATRGDVRALGELTARGFAGTFAGQAEGFGQLGADRDAVEEAQIAALEGQVDRPAFDAYARGNREARKALRSGPDTRKR